MSVAHSFGILVPTSIAARMIEVPSGTVTSRPSIVSVTVFSLLERGVPKSISWISEIGTWEGSVDWDMASSFIQRLAGAAAPRRNPRGNG